jgi:antitoxin (DNA-binding transcriptional repressor) of toxin-antitoxin stability system
MRTVSAMDMRKKLGEILDAASAGERILIERDQKPLAFLVSVEDGHRLDPDREDRIKRRLEALDALVEMGKEYRRAHPRQEGDMTAAEMIRWDRDHRDQEKYERSFGQRAREERRARGGQREGRE